ncbi:MAG: flagellar basal body rod protein FlgB [Gammaproteobacteria bacterium]|nr:flagellar basal body rod protein FlgB [Gammaproteobacteria bacterium]
MRFDLDKAMGIHEQALYVRARRNGIIASNLANADTPNYKARDIDFREALKQSAGKPGEGTMRTTHGNHIQPSGNGAASAEVLYRYPHQASIDGNTVDTQMEKARFAENAVQYQTTLGFLTGRFKGLNEALKGGGQ